MTMKTEHPQIQDEMRLGGDVMRISMDSFRKSPPDQLQNVMDSIQNFRLNEGEDGPPNL